MSSTSTTLTPFIGYACQHCGYHTDREETCSNCGIPVRVNLNLQEFISMINSTYLDIKSRQIRVFQLIKEGFQSGDVELKDFLVKTVMISVLEDLRTNVLPNFQEDCKKLMQQNSELKEQCKELIHFFEQSSKILQVSIWDLQQNQVVNPVSFSFEQFDSDYPKYIHLIQKIKRRKKTGISPILDKQYNSLEPQITGLLLKLQTLKKGLEDIGKIHNLFLSFDSIYQTSLSTMQDKNLKIADVTKMAELESQFTEFRTIFQVRDSLCKLPWENKWELLSRKIRSVLIRIWNIAKVVFSAGGDSY